MGRWPPRSPTPGCPGVVAMRYNVYVVTAAQFMADLYAHLLAGRPSGQAAAAARRALAADPVRQIGAVPVSLQDWAVPSCTRPRRWSCCGRRSARPR